MKPEDIVSEIKRRRDAILTMFEVGGSELFTAEEIATAVIGGTPRTKLDREEYNRVMTTLSDLCEEEKIGRLYAGGKTWYGTHQTVARLEDMLDDLKVDKK
jgi:hypothetical protein